MKTCTCEKSEFEGFVQLKVSEELVWFSICTLLTEAGGVVSVVFIVVPAEVLTEKVTFVEVVSVAFVAVAVSV
jgi:hypothetical protein